MPNLITELDEIATKAGAEPATRGLVTARTSFATKLRVPRSAQFEQEQLEDNEEDDVDTDDSFDWTNSEHKLRLLARFQPLLEKVGTNTAADFVLLSIFIKSPKFPQGMLRIQLPVRVPGGNAPEGSAKFQLASDFKPPVTGVRYSVGRKSYPLGMTFPELKTLPPEVQAFYLSVREKAWFPLVLTDDKQPIIAILCLFRVLPDQSAADLTVEPFYDEQVYNAFFKTQSHLARELESHELRLRRMLAATEALSEVRKATEPALFWQAVSGLFVAREGLGWNHSVIFSWKAESPDSLTCIAACSTKSLGPGRTFLKPSDEVALRRTARQLLKATGSPPIGPFSRACGHTLTIVDAQREAFHKTLCELHMPFDQEAESIRPILGELSNHPIASVLLDSLQAANVSLAPANRWHSIPVQVQDETLFFLVGIETKLSRPEMYQLKLLTTLFIEWTCLLYMEWTD